MNMLGSILSAGAAKPGGLLAPMGEGADGAAAGLGEMFAAVIAAASAPVGGEPGTDGGATVAVPTAAIPMSVSTDADPDAALVTELTQVVLGNGGVARGEAQSLPTPEPLPEKRVLAQAPEGDAQALVVGKDGKGAGKTPRPVLTPMGFDQPVLTKAVAGGAAQSMIAGAVDPAVLQPSDGTEGLTPAAAKPTRRTAKTAEADAAASPVAQPAPTTTAAIVLAAPSAAAPPAQPQTAAFPALAVGAQRKSIGAYRAGMSATPAQTPDSARAGQSTSVAGQEAAPLAVVAGKPDTARLPADATPAKVAPPAELVARMAAETLRPAGNATASPATVKPQAVTPSRPGTANVEAEAPVVPLDDGADTIASATGEMPFQAVFATPSPLRATRPADAIQPQPEKPVATVVTTPAAVPSIAHETGTDAPRAEPSEAVAPPVAANAIAAASPAPVATAVVQAPAIDGVVRTEASAPAAPQLGAVLSDQVIDMGIEGQWIDRLAREITQVADGTGHARFQLSPPNLGRIQVDLWQGEAGGRVHLLTETDEAAIRLREGQSTLQADARLAALSLGQVVIERAAGGNLDGQGQRDQNAQSNPQPQPQSQPRGQDAGQTTQQNGQQQGQPQPGGQNAAGSGPSQGQSGNSGGQHGKSGDPRAVLEERGQDAGTTTGGESRIRYA